jgi:flotillin
MSAVLVAVVAIVVALALVVGLVASRYKVAGPNQSFIITGRKGKAVRNPETGEVTTDLSGQKVIMGASVFVVPVVQRLHRIDLSSRRISVSIREAVSSQGIRCNLDGVAIVKVGGSEGSVRLAGQRFLDQQDEIEPFTQEVLAGSLRAIAGRLTIEQIIKDRTSFASAVAEEAESSLSNQGLVLDTFQLQDIQTEGSYITDLGRPEAARARQVADIAEARARQESERERLIAAQRIAESERDYAVRQAEIEVETAEARARAAAAGPLAKAAQDQGVIQAQEMVAERQAALTERQLDTEIRRPADARRYQVEIEAEAAKNATIARAEAEREATRLGAEAAAEQARLAGEGERNRRAAVAAALQAEGEGERNRRAALAEALRAEGEAQAANVRVAGEAEAASILARGEAEAEAMRRRAEAFNQYGAAATLDQIVTVLPEVVRAGAEPIRAIDKLTVISTDGASSVSKSVASTVGTGMEMASSLLGVDVAALTRDLVGRRGVDGSTVSPSAERPVVPEPERPAEGNGPGDA